MKRCPGEPALRHKCDSRPIRVSACLDLDVPFPTGGSGLKSGRFRERIIGAISTSRRNSPLVFSFEPRCQGLLLSI